MSCRTNCCKTFVFALLALAILAVPAFAQTCLQDEYNKVQKQKLNCTANDVSIAGINNITDLTGNTITTCIEGATFSFIADFEVKTTSSQARENIGLYIANASTTQALTGTCDDAIISPNNSAQYHETDPAPDNCGDTQSGDFSPAFGAGTEDVKLEIDNFLCVAPKGSSTLVLPNCTSWQIPGGTIQCVSSPPSFPYPFNGPGGTPTAIPGTPSKCNCGIISLPITPVTPTVIVQKACTTAQTPGPATFTQNPNTQKPTSCDVGNGTTTESGIATYTVAITNTTGTSAITVDQICDSAYGNVFTAGTFTGTACAVGTQCPAGSIAGSYCGNTGTTCGALDIPATTPPTTDTCTFTAGPQLELTTVSDTVSVVGHADINTSKTFGPSSSNSVSVKSTEVPSTATVTKGFVGTEAGCATVRYSVDVKNTSTLDEALTLSALTDSPYGDLTKCTNTSCANNSGANGTFQILGTTCGVDKSLAGLGTLSGSVGAGTFGTIATGATYSCQFDGQFCSALDNNSCISNPDTASATLKGDEASDTAFTQGGNTLTVQECFTAHVSSTGP